MDDIRKALKADFIQLMHSVISSKFIFCFTLLVVGLARGGAEGYGAAALAVTIFTGTKAYQNVQLAKINGKGGR